MADWPEHPPFATWAPTMRTLQLWTQVVGKVRVALSPWLNHGWQVPLYVTARGLGTSAIHDRGAVFEIDLDFIDHRLVLRRSDGPDSGFALVPMSVADFYRRLMSLLEDAGHAVTIDLMPNETPEPIAFPTDEAAREYDASAVHGWWQALAQADRVFKQFRTGFLGKASPVHFFWGSFDLAVTRFSGRPAPRHPGGIPHLPDAVTREAYSHEVSSAGYWPGDDAHEASFYSYAYPAVPGFAEASVGPAGAYWEAALGEWLLPYAAVRAAPDPDAALLEFLEGTYRAASGHWPEGLTCGLGVPGVPRAV